jgi:hypothetical protein
MGREASMSHLRIVKPEGLKPARQNGGPRHEALVFTPEEQRKLRQAIRNLKDAFGTWACLAEAMGMPVGSLVNAVGGKQRGLSPAIVIRAMRASGLSFAEILGGPVPADRCRACGQLKRKTS